MAQSTRPSARSSASHTTAILAFLHGTLIVAALFLFVLADREDRIFDLIVEENVDSRMTDRQKIITLLDVTHRLLAERSALLGLAADTKSGYPLLRSSDVYLLTSTACGGYTHVLGRLLQRAGYEVRIAQMFCEEIWGCHIVLEVKLGEDWAVLDALHNLYFVSKQGKLASFEDVNSDWAYFSNTLGSAYDAKYDFEGVRYTNWEKVPFVLPALKSALKITLGDKADYISLRAYVLNKYWALLVLVGAVCVLVLSVTVGVVIRGRRREAS